LTERRHSNCEKGLKETLAELNLEYLDLYLMHFPVGAGRKFDHVETWKCMETLVRTSGPRTRFIGISNFSPKQLDELLASNPKIKPKVHQMELHPYLQQNDWVARHKKEGITVVAYAPLGNTSPPYRTLGGPNSPMPLLTNPVIIDIAKKHGCTPAQAVLAWNMRRGVGVIPKSVHVDRQKENFLAQGKCLLTDEDDAKIKGMEGKWVGRFNNPCSMMRMPCFQGMEVSLFCPTREKMSTNSWHRPILMRIKANLRRNVCVCSRNGEHLMSPIKISNMPRLEKHSDIGMRLYSNLMPLSRHRR